jgi:hypothetical protein
MTQMTMTAAYDASKSTPCSIKPTDKVMAHGRYFTVLSLEPDAYAVPMARCISHDHGLDALLKLTEIEIHFSR